MTVTETGERSILDDLPRGFKLTPPSGKSFLVAIFRKNGNLVVQSKESGEWKDASNLLADLMMPEQRLGEWDIEPVDSVPNPPEGYK